MREFLRSISSGYELNGVSELDVQQLPNFLSARYGTVSDAKRQLGDVAAIRAAFTDFQQSIYRL